jgi:hypothetical protein
VTLPPSPMPQPHHQLPTVTVDVLLSNDDDVIIPPDNDDDADAVGPADDVRWDAGMVAGGATDLQKPPTTTSTTTTTTVEGESFYYADEASLYSIAENSQEEEERWEEHCNNHHHQNDNNIASPPQLPKNTATSSNDSSSTTTTGWSPTKSKSSISLKATAQDHGIGGNGSRSSSSSRTTVPMHNRTPFGRKNDVGIELCYAKDVTTTDEVITKASDEDLQIGYYHHPRDRSSRAMATVNTCLHRRRRRSRDGDQPRAWVIVVLLCMILFMGVVGLAVLLVVDQKRQRERPSVASSIASNNVPTVTPIPPESKISVGPSVSIIQNKNTTTTTTSNTTKDENGDHVKYVLSENYVYEAIRNCPGTGTFFQTHTIPGQVFDQLVQEVYHLANYSNTTTTTTTSTASSSSSNNNNQFITYAPHHTHHYIREKYSLNVFYLSTNGPTSWKNHTNWMTRTDPCNIHTPWVGVECSSSSSRSSSSNHTTNSTILSQVSTTSATMEATSSSSSCSSSTTTDSSSSSIIGLHLNQYNLSGTLPMELCCMPCIQSMDMSDNQLHGKILWCLREMPTLEHIAFDGNQFNST